MELSAARWMPALLAAALLAGSAARPAAAQRAAAAQPAAAKTRVAPRPRGAVPLGAAEISLGPGLGAPGVTVSMAPVGLSLEYPVMAEDLAGGACPAPALAHELLRLGSPPLQLGGVSQDMTAPGGALGAQPSSWDSATLFSLPAPFWSELHCLLSATRDPVTVGLNLRSGSLAWAEQMAAGAQGAAAGGLSFSLGNEPDRYVVPNYLALDKPLPNGEAIAVNLYLQLVGYLRSAVGGAPLIGPEMSKPAHWRRQLPRVIAALREQTVGVHSYPLTICSSPRAATVAGLLSPSSANAPARLAWVVSEARAAGLPAIVSEANSVSCGGKPGVSNSPASAVWAVRFVLSALRTGFREVRFHFSGNPYDPFVVRGGVLLSRPLESALVALNGWLPVGSSLRTVAGVRGLLATAVSQPGGGTVLLLDNEGASAHPVVLRTTRAVQLGVLRAARAGLATVTVAPTRGRVRLSVAPSSVAAVSLVGAGR